MEDFLGLETSDLGNCIANPARIAELNQSTSLLFLIVHTCREGGTRLIRDIEYSHYPPGTPANRDFNILVVPFSVGHFIVVMVPLIDRAKIEETCARNEFRLANGIPMLVRPPGMQLNAMVNLRRDSAQKSGMTPIKVFPIDNRRAFTIEPIFKGPPKPSIHAIMVGIEDQATKAMREMVLEIVARKSGTNN